MNKGIINSLLNFSLITIIFLAILYVSFTIFSKKFKFNKKYIELYGIFLNLNTNSLIALSSYTINYLFLIWLMTGFRELNIIYVSICLILSFIGNIIMDDFRGIGKSFIITLSNLIAIELVHVIYIYLVNEYRSIILIIILFLVMIFVFMYFTYNLINSINNNIITKNNKSKM